MTRERRQSLEMEVVLDLLPALVPFTRKDAGEAGLLGCRVWEAARSTEPLDALVSKGWASFKSL